ncbi:MAG TPA: hypothetical protein VHN74_09795 [Candidatus Angelobacter sp.]|nr:hypothetical protein [Candidatus Angelobacter sp.]
MKAAMVAGPNTPSSCDRCPGAAIKPFAARWGVNRCLVCTHVHRHVKDLVGNVLVIKFIEAQLFPVIALVNLLGDLQRFGCRTGEEAGGQAGVEFFSNAETGTAAGVFGHFSGKSCVFMTHDESKSGLEVGQGDSFGYIRYLFYAEQRSNWQLAIGN